MFVQSHEKLGKNMDMTICTYKKLHSVLKSLIKLHNILSIDAQRETRPEEEVK